MEESAEKKILGMDAGMVAAMVAVLGLFLTILSVVTVLAIFAFNTIRADNARIEARIEALRTDQKADNVALRAEQKADNAELRAQQKADIAALRAERKADIAEQRADIDMLSDKIDAGIDSLDAKIDALDDNLDTRLDEIEREQARTQGAIDVLRARQAPNP